MSGSKKATIVQRANQLDATVADEQKIIYAENEDKLVLYTKKPFEMGKTYVYDRKSQKVYVNNNPGTLNDKRDMIKIGMNFLKNTSENDLVTLDVFSDNNNESN